MIGVAAWVILATASSAHESDDEQAIIVTAPGGAIDLDDALELSGSDVNRAGTPDLLSALSREMAGVTLQEARGSPWQPNLVYRGFIASPLEGQAQGLAVYMDGARFNQPFGDTVQFDLIPEAAIQSLSILDASPVYGLNALGGAIALKTKSGLTDPGLEANMAGGRFGSFEANVSGGFTARVFNGFVALNYSHDNGWRDHSPSRLYNGYLDLGFDRSGGGLHLKLIGADTNLTGNGVAPVELLAADRRAVFTWPDITRSRYGRISLHPWTALSDATRIEGSLYAQHLTSRSVNGDLADIEGCEDEPGLICLETIGDGDEDESQAVLTDSAGNPIADTLGGDGYGVLNRARTHTRARGVLIQIIDTRRLGSGENHLSVGFSYDGSRTHFDTSTELGALTSDRGVDGLGSPIAQNDGAIGPISLIAHTGYWGLFAQDRLPILPGLSAELGLRYNHARIRLDDQIGTALNGRHRFERLNPGIEFDYELSRRITLRAGYAESNRVPTPAELSCADEHAPCSLANFFIADPPLNQVIAKSWELGAAGEGNINGLKIEWLLSAYRTYNRNDIQYIASAIRGRAFFRNIGATRRQGMEATIKASRGGFTGSLSYAFTDATYRDALTLSSPSNPEAEGDGTIAVRRGDRLAGIPRHSAAFSLDYAGRIGERNWSIGGDVVARSSQYLVGDEGNDTPRLHGYAIVNLRAGIDVLPGVTLFGELRNALNRKYATFGTFSEVDRIALAEAPGASNPRAYSPGSPRRWYAGLKARF